MLRVSALLSLAGLALLVGSGVLLHRVVAAIRADRALVEQRGELSRAYETLLVDLNATRREREAVQAIRPKPDNLVRFVEGLEGIAARVFIDQQIAAIPPESDKTGQPYVSPVFRFRVTLTGPAEKLEAYLREVEQLTELVRIERIEILAPPEGNVLSNGRADLLVAVAVSRPP